MVNSKPGLYIVTVHLNNSTSFKRTTDSLVQLNGHYTNWEWLVKDGLSTNLHTLQLQNTLQFFPNDNNKVISCADSGIYDAMNQAVGYLSNDNAYCMFLNAGDILNTEKLHIFKALFDKHSEPDIIYCDHLQPGSNGTKLVKAPENLDFAYLLGKMVNHQSIFIKVKWLKKYPFNTSYKVISDWIQLFSLLKNERILIQYVNEPLVVYEGGGFSEKNNQTRLDERKQFLMCIYSEWELESLQILSRLRSRSWFPLLTKSLNSPRRSALLSLLSRII